MSEFTISDNLKYYECMVRKSVGYYSTYIFSD